jgi:ankyrin repeat protein
MQTALTAAICAGSTATVDSLVAHHVFVTPPKGDTRRTPLMLAAERKQPEILEHLIAAGADVDAVDGTGSTALMVAAQRDPASMTARLLAAGADLNMQDKRGQTALMHAVVAGRVDNVDALVRGGADVRARDKSGASALSLATKGRNREIATRLQAAGAN